MRRGVCAETIRLFARVTSVLAPLSLCAAVSAQTATFVASPVVFPATGANDAQTQTVNVTVNASTVISSISVPLAFNGLPEFMLVDQGGCKSDGTTSTAAGTVCRMVVRFRPAQAGRRNASLVITDAGGNMTAIPMSGVGYYPQVAITPAATKIIAGLGPTNQAYTGDGDSAQLAGTSGPQGIVADSFGNVYFADTNNNAVRMLDAFGNITTVAGGGLQAGVGGDGGPATSAALSHPTWLALDAAGNLFITESGNNVVRRVAMSTSRIITTVAGSYKAGNSNGTSATTAQLNNPQGIAVDPSGNFFIVDGGNHLIRRVDAVSGLMSTFAGNGASGFNTASTPALSASFYFPVGIALDTSGNVFVSDTGNHAVREISNGNVTVVAGNGASGTPVDGVLATNTPLGTPSGVAISPAGDTYFVDTLYGVVRKVQASDGMIETIAGTAKDAGSFSNGVLPSTSVRMSLPIGLAFDSFFNLFITDTSNNVVRELSPSPGELAYAAQAVGNTSSALKLKVANIGNASLGLTGVTAANATTSSNFTFTSSTTEPCVSTVGMGAHCAYNVSFAPQMSGFIAGELDVTHTSNNPNFNTAEPVYLSAGVMPALAISPGSIDPVVATHAMNLPVTVSGGFGAITTDIEGALPAGVTTSSNGGIITLSGTPTQEGTFPLTVYASDALGDSITKTYSLTVLPALLTVTVQESVHSSDAVTELPELQVTVMETVHTSDTPAVAPQINITITETIHAADSLSEAPSKVLNIMEAIHVSDGLSALPSVALAVNEVVHVSDSSTDVPSQNLAVSETIHVSDSMTSSTAKAPQTITVAAIPAHTYGDAAFSVLATSSAGLPVTMTVESGPAIVANNRLDLTGAGSVTLLFSQAGDANTAAAKSVENTFAVAPATATITANDATRAFETANPTFTYSVSGLVHGDTVTAIAGVPTLTTTAVLNSPAANYPINVTQGTLSAANYALNFVPGTLTVTGHVSQAITFLAIPNLPLSVGSISLTATSTSGLPVVFTVSGPATIVKKTLTITGAGSITVTATQPGNATFNPAAQVQRTFTVTP